MVGAILLTVGVGLFGHAITKGRPVRVYPPEEKLSTRFFLAVKDSWQEAKQK